MLHLPWLRRVVLSALSVELAGSILSSSFPGPVFESSTGAPSTNARFSGVREALYRALCFDMSFRVMTVCFPSDTDPVLSLYPDNSISSLARGEEDRAQLNCSLATILVIELPNGNFRRPSPILALMKEDMLVAQWGENIGSPRACYF